jgi:hypothetical protein
MAWQAARLAHHEGQVDHAFWVDIPCLYDGLQSIAFNVADVPPPGHEIPQYVKQWLIRRGNGTWVLVIDEADHKFEKDLGFIPRGLAHGYQILTTSSKEVALEFLRYSGDHLFQVPNLEPDEARHLFKQLLGDSRSIELWKSPGGQEEALSLVKKLDCHPGMWKGAVHRS